MCSQTALFIHNIGGKRGFMRCGINSFPMLLYPICHVLPGFDILFFVILPHSVLASPLSRWRQNILAAKRDIGTKGGPHGYTEPARILWQRQISAAVIILAKMRDAAKLRRSLSCLQRSAAHKSNSAVLLLAVLHSLATWDLGLISCNFHMGEKMSVLPTPSKTITSCILFS